MKPALAIDNPEGGRSYLHPITGETVPSVTTILKVITKPELDGWAARLTARHAVDHWDELGDVSPGDRYEILKEVHSAERQAKADRGTLVHELADAWAKGNPPVIDKSVGSYASQFFGFLSDVRPQYIESEATVWNTQYSYAGTFDFIAMIDGYVTLVDLKTGRGVYPEHGLQLAALAHGECIIDERGNEWNMPSIQRHALLHLRPRSWRLVPVYEMEANFIAFLAARKVYHWIHEVAPDVLGDPNA